MPDKEEKEKKTDGPTLGERFRDATIRTISSANPIAGLGAQLGVAIYEDPSKGTRIATGFADGVRDLFRDVPWAVVWVFDKGGEVIGLDMNSGDRGYSDATAQAIEDFLDDYAKQPVGLGQAEFRMAAGWQLRPGMKYNGQENAVYPPGKNEQHAGEPITEIRDITAVFYKDPGGKIEVITSADPRWMDLVGPYGGVQLLAMVASMGTGAAVKGAISLPRAVTFGETATRVLEASGKVAGVVGKGVGTIEGVSSVGILSDQFILEPLYFKPNAMNQLGRMFSHPGTINSDTARSAINTMNSQYSHLTGTMTEQIYIKSLANGQSPWQRLDEISRGKSIGIERVHPFDDIRGRATDPRSYQELPNTNIKNIIQTNPEFMSTYYNLVTRALNGGLEKNARDGLRLSDQELFSLKFMMNVNSLGGFHMDLTRGPVLANEAERRQAREEIKDNLAMQIANELTVATSKPEDSAESIEAMQTEVKPPTAQEIRAFAGARSSEWGGKYQAQQAEEEQEALRLGQMMAMGMVP